MKKYIITLAFLTFGFVGFAQKTFNLDLQNEILDEYKKDSKAFFINRLSNDFRYTNQQGNYLGKEAILKGDKQNIVSTELLQPVFFQSGDLAISSGIHQTMRIEKDGSKKTGQVAATYTWQRRNDKWMFVGSQQNNIAPNTFDEATFNEMTTHWIKDPVSFFKNECDATFMFTNGNGESFNQEQAIATYTNVITSATKKIENLKVWQSGNTGIATGKTMESYKFKNGGTSNYIGIFTYTFSQSNGKWVLASAQHTDFKAPVADDEAAVRKVIEGSTSDLYAANIDSYLNSWANVPYISRVSFNAAGEVSRMNGEEFRAMIETMRKTWKPDARKITRSDFSIRINGSSAFVVFNQHSDNVDGTKRDTIEERYLEKMSGEWKIINVTVIPKK